MKIGVITDDKRFYRMLELELNELGFEVVSSNFEAGSPIICDLDFCTPDEVRALSRSCEIFGFGKADAGEHPSEQYCSCIFSRPFLMSELREALEKFITGERQIRRQSAEKRISEFGRRKNMLTCNIQKQEAVFGANTVPLSPAETVMLGLLCERRGETVTREELMTALGADGGNITDVYICRLRAKLDNRLGLKFIYTVKGKGYMLK